MRHWEKEKKNISEFSSVWPFLISNRPRISICRFTTKTLLFSYKLTFILSFFLHSRSLHQISLPARELIWKSRDLSTPFRSLLRINWNYVRSLSRFYEMRAFVLKCEIKGWVLSGFYGNFCQIKFVGTQVNGLSSRKNNGHL